MKRKSDDATSGHRLLGAVKVPSSRVCPSLAGAGIAGILGLAGLHPAMAFNLYDGSQVGNNLEINLTTTLSYSGFLRVNNPSAILEGPGNANGNDGDSNLKHGIVGNLFEAVPVLDIRDGDFGAHFSGQFYLNTTYLGTNQNSQPGTLNTIYVNKNTDFSNATRNVNGENAQLLDAFVFGKQQFAGDQTLELKVGRQTLFWGQSLLFPTDGISGGQAPINVITAQDTINAQAQQVFMPVGQAVVTYQPGVYGLTLQAYYQFEWQHDYFQGVGSYFSGGDYLGTGGGQSLILGAVPGLGNEYFLRDKDLSPPSQNGQFGLGIEGQADQMDWGLFALRFDAKAPVIYAYPGQGGINPISTAVATGLHVGQYQAVYPRDIWLQGASLSGTVGSANVAGEMSVREHMPLIPSGFGVPTATNPGNANSDPLYPVGNTFDAQVSTIYVSPGIPLDPGGVSFDGEVVFNHLISVTQNRAALATGRQGSAAAINVIMTPQYYDVLPDLVLTFPIGIEYNFLGRSEFDPSIQHGTGSFNIGISGTYKAVWIASLTYQDFLGKPDPAGNPGADRGYVSLNLQRSF